MHYLQGAGLLDEVTIPGTPQVLIANYFLGPSNCIGVSKYYSQCCISECEALQREIEAKIRAPSATPEELLGVVGNLSLPLADNAVLTQKLHWISERHEGKVPLHGRLFSQWLHYVYPNECPYPHILENRPTLRMNTTDITISKADKEKMMAAVSGIEATVDVERSESGIMWDDEE